MGNTIHFRGRGGEGDRARRPLRSSFAERGSEEGGERGEMKEEEDDDERKKRSTPLRCLARSLARAGLKIRTFSHRPSASAAVPLSSSAAAFERKLLQDEMRSASLLPFLPRSFACSPTPPPSTFGLGESWPPSVRPSPLPLPLSARCNCSFACGTCDSPQLRPTHSGVRCVRRERRRDGRTQDRQSVEESAIPSIHRKSALAPSLVPSAAQRRAHVKRGQMLRRHAAA